MLTRILIGICFFFFLSPEKVRDPFSIALHFVDQFSLREVQFEEREHLFLVLFVLLLTSKQSSDMYRLVIGFGIYASLINHCLFLLSGTDAEEPVQ